MCAHTHFAHVRALRVHSHKNRTNLGASCFPTYVVISTPGAARVLPGPSPPKCALTVKPTCTHGPRRHGPVRKISITYVGVRSFTPGRLHGDWLVTRCVGPDPVRDIYLPSGLLTTSRAPCKEEFLHFFESMHDGFCFVSIHVY